MSHPATLTLDGRGRIWIGTDRGGRSAPQADGLFGCDLEGAGRGVPLPLYGGAARGRDRRRGDGAGWRGALLARCATPGAEPGASFGRPATRWPAFDADLPPRTTLLALARTRGGAVGG